MSLTSITTLCPQAGHINPSLVLVQPRKTRPYIKIVDGTYKIKSNNQIKVSRNVAQYPLHYMTYVPAKFEVLYVQWFRRRCIYKKIQYLTLALGSMSHKLLPSTLYIMCPVFEVATSISHLQENTLFEH